MFIKARKSWHIWDETQPLSTNSGVAIKRQMYGIIKNLIYGIALL